MSLVNETTNLKSLRFGKDRPGGGSSNQPYIKSSPPNSISDLGTTGGPDFLLRGGTLTPGRIFDDGSRLTKMFTDIKSPNGLLFTAKQNILSRTAVAKNGEGKALNEGAYLPTSTILGAAGNPIGLHLNKQGLNPLKGIAGNDSPLNFLNEFDPLGNPFYTDLVKRDSNSRLEKYLKESILEKNLGNLYEYSGGPGSILGIGKTKIPLAKDRTGINNLEVTEPLSPYIFPKPPQRETSEFPDDTNVALARNQSLGGRGGFTPDQLQTTSFKPTPLYIGNFKSSPITLRSPALDDTDLQKKIRNDRDLRLGASIKYVPFLLNPDSRKLIIEKPFNGSNGKFKPPTVFDTNNEKDTNLLSETEQATENNTRTLSYKEILEQPQRVKSGENTIIDFRKSSKTGNNKEINKSIDYAQETPQKRLENRVNLGNPGSKSLKNRNYGYNPIGSPALDKITAYSLYQQSGVGGISQNEELNDLVKFRIGIIDNENPNKKTYIHFRAFLDNMSDNYSAQWDDQKFMGRGENFYRYNGFNREISLGWTVAAQSKGELIPMYQKLNYLASTLAPDYSKSGYMRGNLATLTVGGYLYEQPGIITSINYSVPQESPWEISINTNGDSDTTVKEIPHMIKVTGFNFKPIHNFVPRLQQNKYNGEKGKLSSFGKERYISLSNGKGVDNNNYDSNNYISPNPTPEPTPTTSLIVGELEGETFLDN